MTDVPAAAFPLAPVNRKPSTLRAPIVAFGGNAWQRNNWQTRQQLLSRLADRGWPVTYSTGAVLLSDRASPFWLSAGWKTRTHFADGVRVVKGGRLAARWPRFRRLDRFAAYRHAKFLRACATQPGAPTVGILHLFGAQFEPYVGGFPGWRIVYHVEDAYDMMPGWTPALARMQDRLLQRADLVIACAESMARRLTSRTGVRLLPNGVDCAAQRNGAHEPCPSDLAAIPRPRLGYIGNLNRKVDYSLIAHVAAERPDWHWVLIGHTILPAQSSDPDRSAFEACRRLPNVHVLGAKEFDRLPAYAAHMDVNTVCYRTDGGGWWLACDPLKLPEYLAAGPPVVSVDIENVRQYRGSIFLPRTPAEWVEAISKALVEDTPAWRKERLRLAQERDWSEIVERLSGWLVELASAERLAEPRARAAAR